MIDKEAQVDPGSLNGKLKRKMGRELADIFEAVGKSAYDKTKNRAAEVIADEISAHSDDLAKRIRDDLGKRGIKSAAEFIAPWAESVAADVLAHSSDIVVEKVLAAMKKHFPIETEEEEGGEKTEEKKEGFTMNLIKKHGNGRFSITVKKRVPSEEAAAKFIVASKDKNAIAIKDGDSYIIRTSKWFDTHEDAEKYVASVQKMKVKASAAPSPLPNVDKVKSDLSKMVTLMNIKGKSELAKKTQKILLAISNSK